MSTTNQLEEETVQCKKCQSVINWMATFPGGICVECHSKKFDAQVKRDGGMLPVPNFMSAIKK